MVIFSPYTSIYDNLAYEDLLFKRYTGEGRVLLLYINDPAVVIGRFQNPWAEANLKTLKEKQYSLARRISGGGAVYHDRGNLNYSLFVPRHAFDKDENAAAVAAVLAGLGIDVRSTSRQDLLINGKKISGSAFRIVKMKAYHHGTLLVNADLSDVRELLLPSYPVISGSAVTSVSASVTNIKDEYPHLGMEEIINAFSKESPWSTGDANIAYPPEQEVEARSAELASSEWVFGKTPAFSIDLEGRRVQFPSGQMPRKDGYSLPVQ